MATLWEWFRGQGPAGTEPYCSHCGYTLTGCRDSSKCPECGKPLVEVLARRDQARSMTGRRFRSKARLFGLPVIDIALGAHRDEHRGKARGVIAIGDVATGVIAIGSIARGLVAFGAVAIGGLALGGISLGVLSMAGLALGAFAIGGGAVGLFASGGGACGAVAQGAGACGYAARGASVFATHEVTGSPADAPHAVAMFDRFTWFFGNWPNVHDQMYLLLAGSLITTALLAALILFVTAVNDRTLHSLFTNDDSQARTEAAHADSGG